MTPEQKKMMYLVGGGLLLAALFFKPKKANASTGGGIVIGGGTKPPGGDVVGGNPVTPNSDGPPCLTVTITTQVDPLNIRSQASQFSDKVGEVPRGSTIDVDSQVVGEDVFANNIWYHLKDGRGWISSYYTACP
jgi:hypothetical protein